jgi:DNA mismatch repair protein MutL
VAVVIVGFLVGPATCYRLRAYQCERLIGIQLCLKIKICFFFYEPFGNALKLTGIPAELLKKDAGREFTSIVQEAMDNTRSKASDGTLVSLSCHDAVKAGEELSDWEMKKIVTDLFRTENPYTCPHGRPIIFEISSEDLAKKFHR